MIAMTPFKTRLLSAARNCGASVSGNRWAQALLVLAFWLAGEGVVRALSLPVPGSLVGLAMVLALLLSGRISLARIQRGAECFLADMLLFFVPAVLAITDHREFLSLTGLKILVVIILSTAAVMIATALAIDLSYRWSSSRERSHEHRNAVAE